MLKSHICSVLKLCFEKYPKCKTCIIIVLLVRPTVRPSVRPSVRPTVRPSVRPRSGKCCIACSVGAHQAGHWKQTWKSSWTVGTKRRLLLLSATLLMKLRRLHRFVQCQHLSGCRSAEHRLHLHRHPHRIRLEPELCALHRLLVHTRRADH